MSQLADATVLLDLAMQKTALRIKRNLQALRSLEVTPEMIDRRSERKYRRSVELQRALGRDHVSRHVAQVRRELGL